jgi:hypothetical protein
MRFFRFFGFEKRISHIFYRIIIEKHYVKISTTQKKRGGFDGYNR